MILQSSGGSSLKSRMYTLVRRCAFHSHTVFLSGPLCWKVNQRGSLFTIKGSVRTSTVYSEGLDFFQVNCGINIVSCSILINVHVWIYEKINDGCHCITHKIGKDFCYFIVFIFILKKYKAPFIPSSPYFLLM